MSKQLRDGKAAADVKISLNLSAISPLHAKWIVNLYSTLKDDKEMTINCFRSARITEAIENVKDMIELRDLSRKFGCKTCFFYKHMKQHNDSFFPSCWICFFKLPFPIQCHKTRLWYNKSDIFF